MPGSTREDFVLVAQVFEVHRRGLEKVAKRGAAPLITLVGREDRHELSGIFHRQRMQQHRVHEGEHGGVGANPKGERQRGDGREARSLRQQARAKSQVVEKGHTQIMRLTCVLERARVQIGSH